MPGHASRVRRLINRSLQNQKLRFALVGIINTIVDFSVFLTLAGVIHLPTVFSNIISTSCALTVSYILNKRAVFGSTDTKNRRQLLLFIVVTLCGLWILQPIIIAVVLALVHSSVSQAGQSVVLLTGAKLIASIATLVWNYIWYSKVVFRKAST